MKEVIKDMNINEILLKVKQIANKQDKTDNLLTTTAKTIVGGINEVKLQLEENVQEVNKVKTDYAKKTEVSELTKDKATVNYVNDSVARVSSGTPLFASSISEMTDTTRNYVNTTDGYLYIYNGNAFVKSTVKYQELGLSDNQVTVEKTDFAEKVEVGTEEVSLNNLFTIVGQLSIANGVLKTGVTTHRTTDFIDVEGVSRFFRYVGDGSSNSAYKDHEYCLYGSDKAFISGESRNTSYTVKSYKGKYGCYYDIPEGVKYIRFSLPEVNTESGTGSLYTYLKIISAYDTKLKGMYYEDYIEERLNNSPSIDKPLKDKTIVFMGDSIFGNFRDETGIPSLIAKNTGATVYNLGFGGTDMAGRNDSNSQAIYWDKFSCCRIIDCIETGDFTPMEEALPHMSSALSYFAENIEILKRLDFSKVDIIVWDYGTNDFARGKLLYDNDNPNNIYSYNNAYRYSIEKLLTLYPHIRIIPVTPAWRFWQDGGVYQYDSDTHVINNNKLYDFVESAEKSTKAYHLPIINIYDILGANKFTRSQYFNDTDGTHFNSNGRVRYAGILSNLIPIFTKS